MIEYRQKALCVKLMDCHASSGTFVKLSEEEQPKGYGLHCQAQHMWALGRSLHCQAQHMWALGRSLHCQAQHMCALESVP